MTRATIYRLGRQPDRHGFKFHKYAKRYLGEVQYRFNRRFNLSSMVQRLLYACVQTPPRNERQLRLAEACN